MIRLLEAVAIAAVTLLAGTLAAACLLGGAFVGALLATFGYRPLAFNVLMISDFAGNAFPLFGRAGETISHRIARMREYGGAWERRTGCVLCACLTRLFWFNHQDHCAAALDRKDVGISSEEWKWSK